MFNEWKLWRKLPISSDLSEWNDEDMIQWLPKFLHEVRKKDGTLYPNKSLYSIVAGLQYHVNVNNPDRPKVNFL